MAEEPGVSPRPPSAVDDARTRTIVLRAARTVAASGGGTVTSLTAVAVSAGCTEADIVRLFGSAQGLREAVVRDVAEVFGRFAADVNQRGPAAFAPMLRVLSTDEGLRLLLARSVVDDRDVLVALSHDNPVNALVRWIEHSRGRTRGRVPVRTRVCVFASVSLLAGWLILTEPMVAGLGLDVFGPDECNDAMADAASTIALAALSSEPPLRTNLVPMRRIALPEEDILPIDGPTADDVEKLFQSASIDTTTFVEVLRQRTNLPMRIAQRSIAGNAIAGDSDDFPVLRELLARFGGPPSGAPGAGLADPRLAACAAAALVAGSVIAESKLRLLAGVDSSIDVNPAIASFVGVLLARHRSGSGPDAAHP